MMKKYFNKKGNSINWEDHKMIGIKTPPYSLEAEQSVLGGLMIDNEKWEQISEKLNKKDFFSHPHRIIFSEMQLLFERRSPIDLITLSESLNQKENLGKVGGFAYLAELAKNIPSVANINAYANIIRERAIIREMIEVANEIADAGYDPKGRTSQELIDLAESLIFQISEVRSKQGRGPKRIEEVLSETVRKIEKLRQKPYSNLTGISTGYKDLDEKTAGLQNSDLIIIAARPSMGKTTFAMNLCEHVAMTEEKPVLIFSLEMPAHQIMVRMLSSLSRVEQTKIRTGRLKDEDWSRISNTIKSLIEKNNIYIDDSSGLTPTEIRSRARRIYRENSGLSLIMIDYLQLMKVPSIYENRTLEIAEISRSLKSLAKELKIPIIALSQLNRSLEQRADKKPVNSDLRESGSIEQDADLIMFIYRDEMYNDNSNLKGIAEIIISKQRNGPIGKVHLTFNGQWSRFDNYSDMSALYYD
ncbi:replicative DNA helicase [Candidatus Riesia pediculicola]|nr:replicative DNA helicase [Candidatus Riesia pediculicola]